jgi:SAM-dependent methyltransferase
MGADRHSGDMVEYCEQIFKHHNIKPIKGLDMCCGTGTAIKMFCEMGFDMSGLDQSEKMLTEAAKKLKKQNVSLHKRSLPNFIIRKKNSRAVEKFDLITSFYDSLNYIKSEKKLKAAFKSVHRHLDNKGWFIFDMNTPESLKTIWDEHTYAGALKDMAWIWVNEYDPKKKQAACHATFFKKKGKLYERFDETHYEKGYANSVIKKLLKEAGFKIKGFYHCHSFTSPHKKTYRICAVVQKV